MEAREAIYFAWVYKLWYTLLGRLTYLWLDDGYILNHLGGNCINLEC